MIENPPTDIGRIKTQTATHFDRRQDATLSEAVDTFPRQAKKPRHFIGLPETVIPRS